MRVAKILGKVTSASFEIPRGADVSLRIAVPEEWLSLGRTIEVELPRNLTCARCSGGGCSSCNNSGAITLRERSELPEVVQVVLPFQRTVAPASDAVAATGFEPEGASMKVPSNSSLQARAVVIRIPECGGLPDESKGVLVRGMLLLEVSIATFASPNVRLCEAGEEYLSSAKMLRAETRPGDAPNHGGEATQPVRVTRSLRARPRIDDEEGEPPSSRVAPVGSTQPPAVQQVGRNARSSRASLADSDANDAMASAKALQPTARARTTAFYAGAVILAALGLLALLFY